MWYIGIVPPFCGALVHWAMVGGRPDVRLPPTPKNWGLTIFLQSDKLFGNAVGWSEKCTNSQQEANLARIVSAPHCTAQTPQINHPEGWCFWFGVGSVLLT